MIDDCVRLAVVLGVVGAAVVTAAGIQTHPPEPHRHAEGQALENPVPSTRDSVSTGRQRYVFMCRECHGNRGLGDGDMAHAGGEVPDFTDDVWLHGPSDGEMFLVIRDGVTADMQPYANRLSDEDIWHLVNYLKTLAVPDR
ncbi:MAG: cytochrome c [Acidobacteriota bacterium]|nr:cytochrome c [Acidobacteriota bacterium]